MTSSSSTAPSIIGLLLSLMFVLTVEEGIDRNHVVPVKSLLHKDESIISYSPRKPTGMMIFHRERAALATPTEFLLQDESRVASIRRRRRTAPLTSTTSSSTSFTTIPAGTGSALGTSNYVVTVGLGTPRHDLTVIFDTGSDVTWVQCQPCARQCYSQQQPIFDPSASSTYANVTCSSPHCSALRSATGNSGGCSASTCVYAVQYGDGSYSVGFFAEDTLTLSSTDVVPGFLFGCGERNAGLFGQTAGLLGLGRNRLSLVSQTASKHMNVFSYCLPSRSNSTGYLNFGDHNNTTSSSLSSYSFTPMLTDSDLPSFYFLDLVGIKVAGRRVNIRRTVFRRAGTLIDSGTVITRLPPKAYTAVRKAFRRSMSRYPRVEGISILDTCYNLSRFDTVEIPAVEFVFRGRTALEVDVSGIMYAVDGADQVCLALAGNDDEGDMGIIGNMQQRTFEVVYDAARGGIGFGAGGCSELGSAL